MIRTQSIATATLSAALFGLLALGTVAQAKEYNERQHLAPAQRAKIQSIIAWTTNMEATTEDKYRPDDLRPCEELNIGSSPAQPSDPYAPQYGYQSPYGAQQPSEQTIITGDIYNIDGNCYAEPTPSGSGF